MAITTTLTILIIMAIEKNNMKISTNHNTIMHKIIISLIIIIIRNTHNKIFRNLNKFISNSNNIRNNNSQTII